MVHLLLHSNGLYQILTQNRERSKRSTTGNETRNTDYPNSVQGSVPMK